MRTPTLHVPAYGCPQDKAAAAARAAADKAAIERQAAEQQKAAAALAAAKKKAALPPATSADKEQVDNAQRLAAAAATAGAGATNLNKKEAKQLGSMLESQQASVQKAAVRALSAITSSGDSAAAEIAGDGNTLQAIVELASAASTCFVFASARLACLNGTVLNEQGQCPYCVE